MMSKMPFNPFTAIVSGTLGRNKACKDIGHFDFNLDSPAETGEALKQQGCVIIRNAVDSSLTADACAEIKAFISEIKPASGHEGPVENERYVIQPGSGMFNTYSQLAAADKAVVNVRVGKTDADMIDVFNVDFLGGAKVDECKKIMRSDWIQEVVRIAAGKPLLPQNLNLYYNDSVSETRGLHYDNARISIKCFLYLTDVLTHDDGPFCYVPGSHRGLIQLWNRMTGFLFVLPFWRKAMTDAVCVDDKFIKPVLGRAGTVILSFQRGYHQGWRQASGHTRAALVQLYDT